MGSLSDMSAAGTQHCSGFFGGESFCTYEDGDASSKILINAPHGGSLEPPSIPYDRNYGCFRSSDKSCDWSHSCGVKSSKCAAKVSKDSWTSEIADALRHELHSLTGYKPHLVVNKLKRNKMDGNREIKEATFGDPVAIKAFTEYHALIKDAKNAIQGRGLFIDVHGQTHSHGLNELGYQVTTSRLNNDKVVSGYSSLRYIGKNLPKGASFEDILRGTRSIGHFLEQADPSIGAMPSPKNPKPGSRSYFIGGYNTNTYGSRYGGTVDGVQIEIHKDFRFDATKRVKFIKAFAKAIMDYMKTNEY